MHAQPARPFFGRFRLRDALLDLKPSLALAAIGFLCWPMMCGAQMVGPTPQPQGIPVTPEQAEQVEQETWAVHGQATNVWLLQPAFRSPYRGPQSLSPAANGRETVDATLYAGIRPWPGAEIWINPEVDQGFGLSDTFGVAGYPSGEAFKVGKVDPYFLVQRGFLRQTVDLGGETEKLDPDLNQLGGTQTANRLVFTIGKYSIVDIFDTNKYAHDPRNDFFNWSIIDQGAFDYAANSWGFTYGGAAEWYQDWWTARAGVFDLSQAPNSDKLSPGFAQGQFVAELEERHSCGISPASSNSSIGSPAAISEPISTRSRWARPPVKRRQPAPSAVFAPRTVSGSTSNSNSPPILASLLAPACRKAPWRRSISPTSTSRSRRVSR